MAKQKKNIARLILQGISILGILCGGMLVFVALATASKVQRENLAVLCGSLVLSAVILVSGVHLIYMSYLMLRLRAFTLVTREVPTLLAALLVASIYAAAEPVMSFADTLGSETLSRDVKLSYALVSLLLFCLGTPVFTKLSKRLVEAAHVRETGGFRE